MNINWSKECIYDVFIEGDVAGVDLDNLSGFEPIVGQVPLAIVALFLFVLESLTVTSWDFVLQPLRRQ